MPSPEHPLPSAARYPVFPSLLPPREVLQHRYCATFATNADELDAVLHDATRRRFFDGDAQ